MPNKPERKINSKEATAAAEFLRDLDLVVRRAVKKIRSKRVAHHVISAGVCIQDSLTELNQEYETGVTRG